MIKKLPENELDFINRYFNLNICGQKVTAPYFINAGGFFKSPVYAGKGTPEEIENETNSLLQGKTMTSEEIVNFMHQKGIGIDCSGLVYQIIDFRLKAKNEDLERYLPKTSLLNIRKYISRKIKPQNSMGADEFTSEPFSQKIEVKDIKPGDLIRTKSGKHILMVIEVEYDDLNIPLRIKYVESARFYKRDGVRFGEIFLNGDLNLSTARWETKDPSEPINHTYEGWREGINTNGVFTIRSS